MFRLIQLPKLRWIPKALTAHRVSTQLAKDTKKEKEKIHPFAEDIRKIITELLSHCHISYYRTPYDRDLHDLCIQECKLKGYPIDEHWRGKAPISKFIPCGVIVTSTAYGHLKNRSTQVFIAIYTAFVTWVDDTYADDVSGIDTFNERFVTNQEQVIESLDALARCIRETNLHYYGVQANVILTSSMNFITSIILDAKTKGIPVSPHAKSYPTFLRTMSGISESYSMFTFPPEVPVNSYIQAIPELCLGINYFNDVLSFYKEELAGENGNYISNEASKRGEKKIPVLRELTHDVSLCMSRVNNILENSGEAYSAFQSFMGGYVSFHASYDARYHLDDLFSSQ